MIEIERKYTLDDSNRKLLLDGAVFSKKKVMRDVYYDTADFVLTTKDSWLRQRGGAWELKVSLGNSSAQRTDFYHEIEDEAEILAKLNLPAGNIAEVLARFAYVPFIDLQTTRETYIRSPFTIDLDTVLYQDGSLYCLAEIEMMVANKDEIARAEAQIDTFVKTIGLSPKRPRGKVIEYLVTHSPQHYEALVRAGVVRT